MDDIDNLRSVIWTKKDDLRRWYAGLAMQGLISSKTVIGVIAEQISEAESIEDLRCGDESLSSMTARHAFAYADAMLKEDSNGQTS